MRRWLPLVALVAVAIALYSVWRSTSNAPATTIFRPTKAEPNSENRVVSARSQAQPASQESITVPDSRPTEMHAPAPSAAVPSAAKVDPLPEEFASVAPETVLENMRTSLRQYAAMFAGNPVGTNPEITQALQGDNPKHINFLKSDGNRVNSQGELVDTWGTPYFFHQLSATETEIRSAGPDHLMYTSDDLVIH